MPNLVNDFEVRKETLRALGGNPDGLANIYEVDLEILKLIGSGEQGIPDAPIDGVQYARQDGAWVESEPIKVKTTSNNTLQFWSGTQQEYDAIVTKDANTLYVIS